MTKLLRDRPAVFPEIGTRMCQALPRPSMIYGATQTKDMDPVHVVYGAIL